MASVTFRLAVLKEDKSSYISNANAAYDFVRRNIDCDGWLRHTVDPLTFYKLSTLNETSPEGQSFVLLLESARRGFQDWVETCDQSDSITRRSTIGEKRTRSFLGYGMGQYLWHRL